MPSPIGHALGGAIFGLLLIPHRNNPLNPSHSPHPPDPPYLPYLTACVVAACAPDLDFLWGRHSMETHSVVVAALVGMAVWLATRQPRLGLACGLAWASHVVFDWLGSDTTPPIGVMALWPLTNDYFFANAFVFEAISRRYALPNFWRHNTLAVLREMAILLPPAALVWWSHRRERKSVSGGETRKT